MEQNKNGKFVWGIILVCVGCLLILSNLGVVPSFGRLIGLFWPLIIIFTSLMFHFGYYTNRKNVGLLVPGGILLTVGIICQASMLWGLWGFLWPGFILAPAVGLFELYIFGNQEKGLLIPVGILSGLSLIFFTMNFRALGTFARYLVPIILIIIGISILYKNKTQQEQHYAQNGHQDKYEDNSHM
ncbi:MAG: DUF5668 domain-containing protein [Bacillota bacterium]|jgi:hypothetical protein|nr:DUF5668 domain-containing protein [Bacillota bacterium]